MTTAELFNYSIPDYPDGVKAPLPECYTTLISLTSSKSTSAVDIKAPVCASVTGGTGLIGCSGSELWRWDVPTKSAQALTLGTTPSPPSFSGLAGVTSASAGYSKASTSDRVEVRDTFLSPGGFHSLVCLSNGDNCYVSSQSALVKPLAGLKDLKIKCVCWEGRAGISPNSTNEILLGTSQGLVVSTIISGGREQSVRPLLALPHKPPIIRILLYELPKPSPSVDSKIPQTLLSVIIATPTELYLFVGGPTVEDALLSWNSGHRRGGMSPDEISSERILSNIIFESPRKGSYGELHVSPIQSGVLNVSAKGAVDGKRTQKLLWWLTGVGVIISCVTLTETTAEISSPPLVIPFSSKISTALRPSPTLSLPPAPDMTETVPALSIAVTDDYVLLLYETRLDVVSRVTRQQIESLSLPPVRYGVVKFLVPDSVTGAVFLLTSRCFFQIEMRHEHLGVWIEFIDNEDYQSALAAAPPLSKESDYVRCEFARKSLRDGRTREAAEALSGCESIPLEDLAIRLTQEGHLEAVITLIESRLRKMKTLLATPGGSSSLLATHPGVSEAYVLGLRLWLLELGLRGLNSCELDIERLKHLRKVKARDRGSREELSRRIAEAVAERKRRLQIVQNSMLKIETFPDPQISDTVYNLCESLGRPEEARFWANLTEDLGTQVLQCFLDGDPHSALMCLTSQSDPSKTSVTARGNRLARQVALFARFGPQLFHAEPSTFSAVLLNPRSLGSDATDALSKWMEQVAVQNPAALSMLLPALIPCVVNGALGDLHRCEALKLLETLLLKADKKATGLKSRRREPAVPSSWMGLSGVWNLLMALLASCRGTEGDFLRRLHSLSEEPVGGPDLSFLLRFCCELGHRRGVAILLCLAGMHADSVNVALAGGDLELAKLAVRQVPQAAECKKRQLWRRIAEVAAKTLEPPDLLLLLEESNGALRLHENLQYISSSETIGAFRSELCASFEAAETRIKEKQADIDQNRRALANLKAKIREQKAAPVPQLIDSTTPCFSCQRAACLDRFYLFPCGHCIHAVCAHKLKWPFLAQKTKDEYRAAVTALCNALFGFQETEVANAMRLQQLKKAEKAIDEVLSEECLLCGIHMIEVIGTPFLSKTETEEICSPTPLGGSHVSAWRIGQGPLPGECGELTP